jgi:glycerol-3-phosphate acyltransferase PlsX
VVIAHGASTARAVTAACALAASLTRGEITERIKERVGSGEPRRGTHFLRRERNQER